MGYNIKDPTVQLQVNEAMPQSTNSYLPSLFLLLLMAPTPQSTVCVLVFGWPHNSIILSVTIRSICWLSQHTVRTVSIDGIRVQQIVRHHWQQHHNV